MSNSTVEPCVPQDADISWVLISTVLVLGMMPGLGFFEAGLLRSKNTISIIIQIFSGATVVSSMWVILGYSLTFGPDADGRGFIGSGLRGLFINLDYDHCFGNTVIPEALYALFQMMFATITPLLMTGAYAERLAYRPFLIFTVLWEFFVYYPIAHWIWAPDGWLNKMGAQDFAGGIVIHTTAGVSALVAALMLGRRSDFHKHHGEAPYSSLPLTAIGATMLWTGWFGFNGGSALMAGQGAIHAVMNSQVAAAVGGSCFLFYHMWRTGKASLLACINGTIAGLAGVTPASGYITAPAAMVLAVLLAISAHGSIFILKHKLKIDDALDVSSVHGVPGLVGAIYIGFAGSSQIGGADGVVYGGDGKLLGVQCLACLVTAAWSVVFTYGIFKFISLFYKLRVDEAGEQHGLDAHLHAEPIGNADTHDSMAHSHGGHVTGHGHGHGHGTAATRSSHGARSRANSIKTRTYSVGGAMLNASVALHLRQDGSVVVVGEGDVDGVDVDADPREEEDDTVLATIDEEERLIQ